MCVLLLLFHYNLYLKVCFVACFVMFLLFFSELNGLKSLSPNKITCFCNCFEQLITMYELFIEYYFLLYNFKSLLNILFILSFDTRFVQHKS